ncbi:MAG: DUF2460 domain-containing protein [Beijerinckiaceae bacterium]|nr:DUF2460 domain-containing protein [Beijerinckiaceae bacterium]MCZ8298648.1 DUF2460 domain-containing protein [Beijerinckiaceae bacterium]
MAGSFHEIRFPLDIALGARGGPERRTEIIATASGAELRLQRWAHARRRYEAGYGVRGLDRLSELAAFFEERRGRLHGFRFRDRLDWSSAPGNAAPGPFDQPLGTGDGTRRDFALAKTYGGAFEPYRRPITKPVAGSLRLGRDGSELPASIASLDATRGLVTFAEAPPPGAVLTAGFLFDVPVRFDTDRLDIDLSAFEAGAIPSIPLIEIRI